MWMWNFCYTHSPRIYLNACFCFFERITLRGLIHQKTPMHMDFWVFFISLFYYFPIPIFPFIFLMSTRGMISLFKFFIFSLLLHTWTEFQVFNLNFPSILKSSIFYHIYNSSNFKKLNILNFNWYLNDVITT